MRTANPTTTTPATHYTLTVESTTRISPEGEPIAIIDLIAIDATTGRRFIYCGPAPCGTHGEALDLIARVFAWERRGDVARTFDPTRRPEYWVAEGAEPERDGEPDDDADEAYAAVARREFAEIAGLVATPVVAHAVGVLSDGVSVVNGDAQPVKAVKARRARTSRKARVAAVLAAG